METKLFLKTTNQTSRSDFDISEKISNDELVSSEIFDHYVIKANLCSKLLQKNFGREVVPVEVDEIEILKKRFGKHSIDKQLAKYKCFSQLVDYYQTLDTQKILTKDRFQSLESYLNQMKLKIVGLDKFSHLINENSLFEMYNTEHMQVYRSIDFLFYTNYSLMTLETSEWWELFTRTSEVTVQAHAVAQMIFIGAEVQPIINPVPLHTVKELNSRNPRATLMNSVAYAPVHNEKDELFGLLHLFEVEDARSISFSVV